MITQGLRLDLENVADLRIRAVVVADPVLSIRAPQNDLVGGHGWSSFLPVHRIRTAHS